MKKILKLGKIELGISIQRFKNCLLLTNHLGIYKRDNRIELSIWIELFIWNISFYINK